MSVQTLDPKVLDPRVLETQFPNDHLPLLRWLMFTGVTAFGFVLVWYYGLFHLMLVSDKTYISVLIVTLYAATCVHCFVRTLAISRESDRAHRVLALVRAGGPHLRVVGTDVVTADGIKLPAGHVTTHIRNLILKSNLQGGHIDQTLLLRGLADALRGPNQLGSFASDSLMKLGLLGTIVGFILMLAPIAGLDASDHSAMKTSMGLMSDGMAVAMYTTLAGLIGSILVQTQYYMLDDSTAKLFALATDLTEVFVISALEREPDGHPR
jgi:MotA/TolQ/ExbB proton channel family protein